MTSITCVIPNPPYCHSEWPSPSRRVPLTVILSPRHRPAESPSLSFRVALTVPPSPPHCHSEWPSPFRRVPLTVIPSGPHRSAESPPHCSAESPPHCHSEERTTRNLRSPSDGLSVTTTNHRVHRDFRFLTAVRNDSEEAVVGMTIKKAVLGMTSITCHSECPSPFRRVHLTVIRNASSLSFRTHLTVIPRSARRGI